MSNINLLFRDHLCKSLITGCAVTVPRDSLLRFLSILLCPKFSDSPALEMTANTEDVCQSLTPLFTQHRVGDGEKMRKYYSANIDKIFLHLLLLFSTSTSTKYTVSILISPRSVETVSPASDHTFAWRHVSCLTLIPPTRSNDGLQSASINQSRPNVSPQPSRRLENRKENKTDSPSSYLCLKTLPCCVNIFSQNLNFKSLKCWLQ